jgi:hypothetical protein
MKKYLFITFVCVSQFLFSQESVLLRFGGGFLANQYFSSSEEFNNCSGYADIEISPDLGSVFEANIEFRIHKNFQFESGLIYQNYRFDYTYFREGSICFGMQSTSDGNVSQVNNLWMIPLGGSVVLPVKNGEFLLGARIFQTFSSTKKRGTWRYYGRENIVVSDSGITFDAFDDSYVDDEIADFLDPNLQVQYHMAYQHNIADKWQVYAKVMAGTGTVNKSYGYSFWQYSGQVGVVYKLIDYKDLKKRQQEEQEKTPFPLN